MLVKRLLCLSEKVRKRYFADFILRVTSVLRLLGKIHFGTTLTTIVHSDYLDSNIIFLKKEFLKRGHCFGFPERTIFF